MLAPGSSETKYNVDDKLCSRAGLTANFIGESEFSLKAFLPIYGTTRDAPSQFASVAAVAPAFIHHWKPSFIFDDPELRSLLIECSNIFVNLQAQPTNSTRSAYLKFSRAYRSSIRACLERLQELIIDSDPSEEADKFQSYITIFYSIECVWHLCELLLIDVAAENAVVPHLLEWVRFHFPKSESLALELMQLGREVDSNENYWSVVKDLIVKGQLDVARALLNFHSCSESTTFQLADQALKTMPLFNVRGGLSIQKFRSQWQYWATSVEAKLQVGVFAPEPELEEIMRLVVGDRQAWTRLCRDSNCWYEYFPGYLFYREPACKHFELGPLVNSWLTQWLNSQGKQTSTAQMTHLEMVILGLLEKNLPQVLHDIQNMCDNKWFVTHLTDLLFHCGQLNLADEQNDAVRTPEFRDSLIFDFGVQLMATTSLWHIGLDYLEHSPDALGARDVLLARVPFRTEREAFKLIAAAKRCGARFVEQSICKTLVQQNMQLQRYGNALQWAIRSRDCRYITAVVNVFLEHFCRTGEIICGDVLASIGAKMFICPRLIFLVKYYDFQQCYREREFIQAGELLINLLDSKITPDFFWPTLLADVIPLLEFKEPIFATKETSLILHHLEHDLMPLIEKRKRALERKEPIPKDPILSNTLDGKTEDLVQLLRLSCARNLGRSLIIEDALGP